jgi:hypothetical protein
VLSSALSEIQKQLIDCEIEHTRCIRDGKALGKKTNPFRPQYIHLLNLQSLFEFCIPVVQDYGSLLKCCDFDLFKTSFHKLLLFFILCRSKGCSDYQRTMFVFALLLQYWDDHNVPISPLLQSNHTMFSEESGEIALSALARSTPASSRADIKQVQHHWQMVRMQFDYHAELKLNSQRGEKKHRLLRMSLHSCFSFRILFLPKCILRIFYVLILLFFR